MGHEDHRRLFHHQARPPQRIPCCRAASVGCVLARTINISTSRTTSRREAVRASGRVRACTHHHHFHLAHHLLPRNGACKHAPYPNPPSRWIEENGHSSGRSTNPCFTGLIQQYRTCAAKSASSRMWCSQNRLCQIARSLRRIWLCRRSPGGSSRENRDLISRHRPEKSPSPAGSVQTQCR